MRRSDTPHPTHPLSTPHTDAYTRCRSSQRLRSLLCVPLLLLLCPSVCLRRVGEMTASLGGLKSASAIEDGIKRVCRSYTDKADQRFCYYIGGSDDAATSLLRTLSGAMMNHLPAVKVCEKLKAADGQICAVKYEAPPKAIDWATVDLSKMRVKELKHILDGWGEKCEGCTEKGDFISLIDRVKAQHVPLAAGKGDL